jgi:hypothetical protein
VHDTVTGQFPADVRVPTFQVHETRPLLVARFGSRPAARDGPDLYVTVIEQLAPEFVTTAAEALWFGEIGDVRVVKRTLHVAASACPTANRDRTIAIAIESRRIREQPPSFAAHGGSAKAAQAGAMSTSCGG